MIDIGVNLLHEQFAEDREAVLERARAAGVQTLLVTTTDLATSAQAIGFCRSRRLHCTAGVHPHDAKAAGREFAGELKALATAPEVKAIGETGLDFNRNFSPPDVQRAVFAQQLEVATELGKPVFVHDRDSNGEVYSQLAAAASRLKGVVVHCFTGTRMALQAYLEAGFYIGITGWVCDERRGRPLQDLVAEIPLDKLLIETDAPFLLPHNVPTGWHERHTNGEHRRRNEPALLPLVAARLAELYGISVQAIDDATSANARTLFQLGQPA